MISPEAKASGDLILDTSSKTEPNCPLMKKAVWLIKNRQDSANKYIVWGVARISPIQFTQPIVSLALAIGLLSEPITIPIMIALATILFGVVLTRKAIA